MGALNEYEIIEELGKGTYGKVYKVRRKLAIVKARMLGQDVNSAADHVYVLKQVNLEGMSEKDKEETLNEIHVMSQCEHFNIIKYIESFIENGSLNIVRADTTRATNINSALFLTHFFI